MTIQNQNAQIAEQLKFNNESAKDILCVTLDDSIVDYPLDITKDSLNGLCLTAWTKNHVYFSCADIEACSVPRNPPREDMPHSG
jgi:hypothetical protein